MADANGRVFLPPLAHCIATVWAWAEGYGRRRFPNVSVASGQDLALALVRTAAPLVRFVQGGRTLEAAEVGEAYRAAVLDARVIVISDEALGAFSLSDALRLRTAPAEDHQYESGIDLATGRLDAPPGPGRWRLLLDRPGAAPWITEAFSLHEANGNGIVVPWNSLSETVRVRAIDAETGAPLPDACAVPWTEYGDDALFIRGDPICADPQGEIAVPLRESGPRGVIREPTWWIETGWGAERVPPLRRSSQRAPIDVRVPRFGAVRGRLTTATPGTRVQLWMSKRGFVEAFIDEDGSFFLEDVPAGPVTLAIAFGGYAWTSHPILVASGKTSDLDLAVTGATASIAGRIHSGGAGVEALVWVHLLTKPKEAGGSGRGAGHMGLIGTHGSFRVDGLPARAALGLTFIIGAGDDFTIESKEALVLDPGEVRTFDFALPDGAMRLRVVDARTEQPIAGAFVHASAQDRSLDGDRFPGFSYRGPGSAAGTNAEGGVVLRALMVGEPHRIEVAASGYQDVDLDDQFPGRADAPGEILIRLVEAR